MGYQHERERKMTTWADKWNQLIKDGELVKDKQLFVCEYVVLFTQKKDNRDLVGGYQLKKKGKKYQITFGGRDIGLNDMDKTVTYGWMVRSPLSYWQKKADQDRITVYENIYGEC